MTVLTALGTESSARAGGGAGKPCEAGKAVQNRHVVCGPRIVKQPLTLPGTFCAFPGGGPRGNDRWRQMALVPVDRGPTTTITHTHTHKGRQLWACVANFSVLGDTDSVMIARGTERRTTTSCNEQACLDSGMKNRIDRQVVERFF